MTLQDEVRGAGPLDPTQSRPELPTPPVRQLGPIATWLGQAHVFGVLIYTFGVLYDRIPPSFVGLNLLPAMACLALCPRRTLLTLRISLPLVGLVGWLALSWFWSVNPDVTRAQLLTQLPSLLSLLLITGLLPGHATATAVRWSVRITLLLVVEALLTSAGARVSGDSDFVVVGWRGTFPDKNSLGLYLVFALAATLTLDRGRSRIATVIVIVTVLVGSQSATSLSAAALVVLLWRWLHLWRRQRGRRSAFFVLMSFGLIVCAVVAALFNVTAILDVYGKDPDLTGRTEIWAAVVQAIAERPVLGHGAGALLNTQAPSATTLDLWHVIGFGAAHAHNGVLDLTGQLGLIGLGLFAIALWTIFRAATRRLRLDGLGASTVVLTVVAQLVMSVSENVFLGPWLGVVIVLHGIAAAGEGPAAPGPEGSDNRDGVAGPQATATRS